MRQAGARLDDRLISEVIALTPMRSPFGRSCRDGSVQGANLDFTRRRPVRVLDKHARKDLYGLPNSSGRGDFPDFVGPYVQKDPPSPALPATGESRRKARDGQPENIKITLDNCFNLLYI